MEGCKQCGLIDSWCVCEKQAAGPSPVMSDVGLASQGMAPNDDSFDFEALFNSRNWLEKALEAGGAVRTGGGMGMGVAHVDIVLEGRRYDISIKPMRSKNGSNTKITKQ